MMPTFNSGRFPEPKATRAFTFTELLVVIATVAFLAVFGLSLHAAVGQKGSRAYCAGNLRQIGAAVLMYAQDNNDVLPTLKFRDTGNISYPYEMFRFVTPGVFQAAGGPYNLGLIWSQKLIKDGRVFYCPAREPRADNLTFSFYDNPTNLWPYGGDPSASNPGRVRSGFMYFPQLRATTNITIASGVGLQTIPAIHPRATTVPESTWICVTPIKLSEVNLGNSMVVDVTLSSLSFLSHQDRNGVSGVNALFGDGHVAWQSVQRVPSAFSSAVWATLAAGNQQSVESWRYIQSLWQP